MSVHPRTNCYSPMLTKKQKRVLDFIARFIVGNGFSPSYEEMADGLGLLSTSTVHRSVAILERKGRIRRIHNHTRTIEVIQPGSTKKLTRELVEMVLEYQKKTLVDPIGTIAGNLVDQYPTPDDIFRKARECNLAMGAGS